MSEVYFFAAVVGGIFLVIQFLMMMFGLGEVEADGGMDFGSGAETDFDAGADADVDVDGQGIASFGQISFKTLVAFFAFFGLGGMWSESSGMAPALSLGSALIAGLGAFYLVSFVMRKFAQLNSQGNTDLNNALGERAQVYIPVPGNRHGAGKVTVTIQKRTLQVKAVTDGEAMKTGEVCQITDVLDSETLVVASLEEEKNIA